MSTRRAYRLPTPCRVGLRGLARLAGSSSVGESVTSIRRPAVRRGGARVITAGYLLVGLSSFVLLWLGSSVLSKPAYSGLGLVWTVATLFGIGLAAPTEQFVARRMNIGDPGAHIRPLRLLGALGLVSLLACVLIAPRSAAAGALPELTLGMAVCVVGWVLAVAVRAPLAGVGDLTGYSAVLLVEGIGRIAMVGLVWLFPGTGGFLLPLAAGLPLVLAAGVGLVLRIPATPTPPSADAVDGSAEVAPGPSTMTEQAGFMLLAIGFQICLSGAPVLLEWRFGHSLVNTVGAFVSASTYFRTPALLTGGVLTHALVELSHGWGAGDLERFRRARMSGLRQVMILLVGSSGLLSLAAPVALPIYYHGKVDLPLVVLCALPISTVVAVTAGMALQPVLAAGRGMIAGLAWVTGAAVTCLFLALSGDVGWLTAIALVAGPVVALAWGVVANLSLTRHHPRTAASVA